MTSKFYDNETEERVLSVKDRIVKAAKKAGRNEEEITLLGVTKTQPVEAVRALIAAGVYEIGENKIQDIVQKKSHLDDIPHKTHMIGHLQTNKAKFLLGNVDLLQSVDSEKIVIVLDKLYASVGQVLDVLIQVNIGDESSKNGVSSRELFTLTECVCQSEYLRLRGLMAIPPMGLGEGVRPYFQKMRHLFVDIQDKKMDNTINILSMGMSDDFQYAIEEGATMVRVGTDLFGPRVYK